MDYEIDDAVLYKLWWGCHDNSWRFPLPVTEEFGRTESIRGGRHRHRIRTPPYLSATLVDGVVQLDIYFGSGIRAHCLGEAAAWDQAETSSDSGWLYADSDDLPKVWRKPIKAAVARIEKRWQPETIRYRPPRTAHRELTHA